MLRCGKMFRALLLIMAVVAMYAIAADVELYSDKYDFIDVDDILSNDRQREQYYDCFIKAKPCATADAKFFGGILAESLTTKCLKCTEKQKLMLGKMVEWYTTNQPDKWKALVAKLLEDAKAAKTAANA